MSRRWQVYSRTVWPPAWMVVAFVFAWLILEAGFRFIEGTLGSAARGVADMPEIILLRSVVLGGAAGGYAIYRLARFHPSCNRRHAAWLRLMPWKADQPLPLGPVHLVWQDGVVLGVLCALAQWQAHIDPALPVVVFGFVYLLLMTLLLDLQRARMTCLAAGFLWPALVLPSVKGAPTIGLVAALIMVIWHGHRVSLQNFEWRPDAPGRPAPKLRSWESIFTVDTSELASALGGTGPNRTLVNTGWPYHWLSPKPQFNSVSILKSFFVSVLIGWWSYCFMIAFDAVSLPELILAFALVAAVFRLAIYTTGVSTPLSLWGRISTGRLVIPGFDRIFVAPLTAMVVALVGGVVIRHSGLWYRAANAAVFGLIWFVLLGGGPTLRKWFLMGQHRFAPPRMGGKGTNALRQV